jgi:signal-transduction protein with cAMP-binding, CBS, and nucleotidyltransferase domain
VSSQAEVFRKRVRDHMGTAPPVLPATIPLNELVKDLAGARASAAVLHDAAGRPFGIVTEQDVTRRVAFRLPPESAAATVASTPLLSVRDDDLLYRAIGFMRRHRLRHMPVADADGRIVGLLQLDAALAAASDRCMADIKALTHEDTLAGLAGLKAAQARVARDLLDDGVAATAVQALLADINNDIYRRVLALTLAELAATGYGAPPVAFECIVMGSGGRRESLLHPDQDNGFILGDYGDADHTAIDGWFQVLAELMVDRLDAAGIPRCKGGVMATNPVWRKRLTEWQAQVAGWARRRTPQRLLAADILLDFRCVVGEGTMSARLREAVTRTLRSSRPFLGQMFGIHADHEPGLGWLGRFVTQRGDPSVTGRVNVKLKGTLPLTEAVRLLAMRDGIPAESTHQRLTALAAVGTLDPQEASALTRALATFVDLQLRQQLADHAAGRPVGNLVDPEALDPHAREGLRDTFRAVAAVRQKLQLELGRGGVW